MHPNLNKALDSGSLMKQNRRNSCTQITDGEVDTMITETENLASEERHTGKNHKAYFADGYNFSDPVSYQLAY